MTPLSVTGLPLIPMCFRISTKPAKGEGPTGRPHRAGCAPVQPTAVCVEWNARGPRAERQPEGASSRSESLRAAAPLTEWRPCHWPRRGGPWAMFGRRIQGHWPRRPRCQCH